MIDNTIDNESQDIGTTSLEAAPEAPEGSTRKMTLSRLMHLKKKKQAQSKSRAARKRASASRMAQAQRGRA